MDNITNIPYLYTETFDQELTPEEIEKIRTHMNELGIAAGTDPVAVVEASINWLRDKWDERN